MLADGEFGLLFDKDPNSLVKCLNEKNQVFVDLRAKAQSRLIETYNWDHIASQYERIFVNSQHEGNL